MDDVQQQQAIQPSFPRTNKWHPDSNETSSGEATPKHANDGLSFGQDSGYNSYQATTSYSTFNLSSRHGTSVTFATIDEANENECSLNDSNIGPGSSVNLTPKTAASMLLLSNIHLTTPKSANRTKPTRRPIAFDYDGTAGTSVDNLSSFLAPSTPERLPGACRPLNGLAQDTPLRTGNRSANQPIQLTPHKAKGGSHSLKRKHSSFRGKLYSDGDLPLGDENRPRDLNDSFDADCRRLEDISPILNIKRRKHHDHGIEELMRSSTPKTASSQPTFLQFNAIENRPTMKKTLRKFQSFSPSKIKSYNRPLLRQHPFRALERTPEKKKEHRVLAELDMKQSENTAVPPLNLDALLEAPILEDPVKQLEQTVSTVPLLDDFSLTPSKANLIDPELTARSDADGSFPEEDYAMRHVPNYSYAPTLHSILEESPVRAQFMSEKQPVPKTPPSVSKSPRKLKRLGTNGTVSPASSSSRSVRSLSRHSVRASVSPKAHRSCGTQNPSLKTTKPYSYCGFEYVNILKQLNKRNSDALGILLEYLADTDLVQVVRVSRGWRSIILNHSNSRRRLQRYLEQQELNKENGSICQREAELIPDGQIPTGIKDSFEHNEKPADDSEVAVRKPFHRMDGSHNVMRKSSVTNVTQSPLVSPSMRKFVINQKIASHLKKTDQLRPCPRCDHPSKIIFSRATQSDLNKSRPSNHIPSFTETGNLSGGRNNNEYLEKSPDCVRKNLFNDSMPSVTGTTSKPSSCVRLNSSGPYRSSNQRMKLRSATAKRLDCSSTSSSNEDQHDTRDAKCDYAICSGKFCGFKFCIKCLCEYHPNTACADLSVNSPTKEEDRGQSNVACTWQSRRSLLRLCRK